MTSIRTWARKSFLGLTSTLVEATEKVVQLPRNIKQSGLLLLDVFFVTTAIYMSIALRYGHTDFYLGPVEYACAAVTVVLSAIIFLRQGLYRAVIRFMGQQATWAIVRGVSYSTLVLGAAIFFSRAQVPRSLPFIYWGFALFLVGGTRLLIRAYYQGKLHSLCEKVIIYGAGETGRQLVTALNQGDRFRAVCFVDDDPHLHNSVINGLQIKKSEKIPKLIEQYGATQVLLALPSVSGERRKEIINSLVNLPVYVRTVPKFSDLLLGKADVGQIEDIALEDLLGRDPVPPHPELLDECITDKVVMVTGAGGSIGSELCRQILISNPRELVLMDNSEYALYNIERELRAVLEKSGMETEMISLLGSVQDQRRLQRIFSTFKVQTVYHAAAYKHVPLVEYNVAEGVANNVFGTWYAAEAALESGVENFVLISTDKAVRPTNIMGASKRFAEMLCQSLGKSQHRTRFSMVRFGNVLGSSGSVVPLFREQIHAGGPITVTHAEVSRYFMTIPEAAQLVLQASAMGEGGDVFVLNMGEPVRVLDLARRMIRLSGLSIREDEYPEGDIEIQFTGLRPGEKLYEELLLGDNVTGTGHPMIMRADEECPSSEELKNWLVHLEEYCDEMDCERIKSVLLEAVSGFHEHETMHDYLWSKKASNAEEVPSNVQVLFPERGADH